VGSEVAIRVDPGVDLSDLVVLETDPDVVI